MTGFYMDGDICWNCRHFDCAFISHRGCRVANQWDYHRQYMCDKRGLSFWNSNDIILDGSCLLFRGGLNEARYNYGCVEPTGNGGDLWRASNSFDEIDNTGAFEYTPLYGYGSEVAEDEEDCDDVY